MLYTAATKSIEDAAKTSPELRAQYAGEVSEVLQALESGEGEVHALWRETRQWFLDAFDEIYQWLGARFDHVFYESEMEKPGQIGSTGNTRPDRQVMGSDAAAGPGAVFFWSARGRL